MATVIRIFPEEGGHHEYNLADFGGQLPSCGDCLIKPPSEPAQDAPVEVWEVIARIFDPGRAFDGASYLRLIVRTRRASALELASFG